MKMTEDFPEELKYNEDYSWIKKEDEETIFLGIIKPAADRIQEFVFIALPEKGEKMQKGETYTSLEAMKWSGHLSSPITGEIIEVNQELFQEPKKINQDPYKEWIVKMKLENKEELQELMNAEQAEKWWREKGKKS